MGTLQLERSEWRMLLLPVIVVDSEEDLETEVEEVEVEEEVTEDVVEEEDVEEEERRRKIGFLLPSWAAW